MLILHNDLNDTKMEFFFDVGLSVDPLDPQVYPPPGPPGGQSIGDP